MGGKKKKKLGSARALVRVVPGTGSGRGRALEWAMPGSRGELGPTRAVPGAGCLGPCCEAGEGEGRSCEKNQESPGVSYCGGSAIKNFSSLPINPDFPIGPQ